MGAFTRDQQAILQGMGRTIFSYVGTLHEVLNFVGNRYGALQNLLFTKGLITEEELDLAIKETEARVAVEMAVSPEIKAAEEKFKQLWAKKPARKVRGRPRRRKK
ncbi:MAG: hypothetical protein ACE5KI_07515 [Dehalococcoidia bacterium]